MATPLKLATRRAIPQIWYSQVRHGHKFRTKKPRPKPMERRIFEAVTAPVIEKPMPYLRFSCRDPATSQVKEENPYEQFLIRQLRKTVEQSEMIIICHRLPCSSVRLREIKIDLKLKDLYMHVLNNTHMGEIIKDTEKANLSYLLTGDSIMITSKDVKIKEVWNVLRKCSEIVPLGGYVKNRLITKQQIQELSKLPSIELQLGELVSILNLIGGARTSSLLSSHQQTLSATLQQYHKQESENS
ncbi:uncharacterized protein LOC123538696 isoform X2 [Mercenaria mercenaria]|uniref:uncharacterized protein LOC123538696 isoform X2 n=1 Tax=Mercenaria mercenaria TaxID=6596 RepID=UPI00234E58A8|nr:uncharacterized protein LOC123538696 isoform X2 [Mercenaria mercenaria]